MGRLTKIERPTDRQWWKFILWVGFLTNNPRVCLVSTQIKPRGQQIGLPISNSSFHNVRIIWLAHHVCDFQGVNRSGKKNIYSFSCCSCSSVSPSDSCSAIAFCLDILICDRMLSLSVISTGSFACTFWNWNQGFSFFLSNLNWVYTFRQPFHPSSKVFLKCFFSLQNQNVRKELT